MGRALGDAPTTVGGGDCGSLPGAGGEDDGFVCLTGNIGCVEGVGVGAG